MTDTQPILNRAFYARKTVRVARDLIGMCLRVRPKGARHASHFLITETEAYLGEGDPASHACRGPTPRSRIMFGPPGHAYVYLVYGMYHCLNVVTEPDGVSGAVLIRGVVSAGGGLCLDGPGKLCRALGISRADNGRDFVTDPDFGITRPKRPPGWRLLRGPRIGIRKGQDLPYRFYVQKCRIPL